MQRKRTPKGLSAAARQAVDDYYANPCTELSSRHPEIAERLDVLERYWVATQGLPVRKAAKVVGAPRECSMCRPLSCLAMSPEM